MLPCVFVMLPNKTEAVYQVFLRRLKIEAAHRNFILNPTWLMTDFEKAIHNAFLSEFPRISIKDCFFHFTQAVWKNIADFGLRKLYIDNSAFTKWLKKFMCLAFVPIDRVQDGFDFILARRPTNSKKVSAFVNYFKSTWMKRDATSTRGKKRKGCLTELSNHISTKYIFLIKLASSLQHGTIRTQSDREQTTTLKASIAN